MIEETYFIQKESYAEMRAAWINPEHERNNLVTHHLASMSKKHTPSCFLEWGKINEKE